jgi:tetratricopeptide (TPR) repeat protein
MRVLLLFLFVLAGSSRALDSQSLWQEATMAYEGRDFQQAAAAFDSLQQAGYGGFELYYNSGNAWFKSGEAGRAILNWERARQIEPRDRNVLANLDLARTALVDRFEEPVRLPIWDVLDRFFAALPQALPAWLLLFLLLPFSLLIGRLLYLWRRGKPLPSRYLIVMTALPVLATVLLLVMHDRWQHSQDKAVILDARVECYAAPVKGAQVLFDLHAGSMLTVSRSSKDMNGEVWHELELPDGRRAWCRASQAERIMQDLSSSKEP